MIHDCLLLIICTIRAEELQSHLYKSQQPFFLSCYVVTEDSRHSLVYITAFKIKITVCRFFLSFYPKLAL